MIIPDFYDFLKENECRAIKDRRNGYIEAWVHVPPYDVREFKDLVERCFGVDVLCEGGLECHLMPTSLCVNIENIIDVEEYVNCFPEGIEDF